MPLKLPVLLQTQLFPRCLWAQKYLSCICWAVAPVSFQEEFLYQVMPNHGIKDGFGRSLQRGLGRSTNTAWHPSSIIRQDKPLWMLGITQMTFSAMAPPLGPCSCEEKLSPLQSCPFASSHAPFMDFWWVKPCPALVLFICIFMSCLIQKSSHTDHLLCVHTLLWAFHAHRSNFAEREALGPT